jgi:hypothetical protein
MAGQGLLVETGPANPDCVETSDTSATSPPDAVTEQDLPHAQVARRNLLYGNP